MCRHTIRIFLAVSVITRHRISVNVEAHNQFSLIPHMHTDIIDIYTYVYTSIHTLCRDILPLLIGAKDSLQLRGPKFATCLFSSSRLALLSLMCASIDVRIMWIHMY